MDIYKITNSISGKCYVGFSKNAEHRFNRHISLARNGVNRRLYDSMRKHGISNFTLEIITTCDTRDEAIELEKFWISKLDSMMPNGYNMTRGGDGGNTLQGWTDAQRTELYSRQAKTRIGSTHSEITRQKISEAHRGKVMPIEQRLRLSKTMKELGIRPPLTIGKTPWIAGKSHSPDARRKISEAKVGKSWESLWSAEYVEERKIKMRDVFSGKNNPNFVEFNLEDKIKILKTIASSSGFRLKDINRLTGFSEFKIRELLREVGVLNFQSFKKENKEDWENSVYKLILNMFQEGDDVSTLLGIQKWESVLPACLSGEAKGLFPSCIPKTDQERIQNMQFEDLLEGKYEITEKLHGSSMTVLLDSDGNFEVCSRNLSLKEQEHNAYWMVANKYNLKQKMIEHGFLGYAIQGELCGAGINGNQYNLDLDLFVFDVLKEQDSVYTYLSANERTELCAKLGLKHVPVLGHRSIAEVGYDTESLLLNAEGKSMLNGSEREGLVFKHLSNPEYSFKVISTKWLIKNKE